MKDLDNFNYGEQNVLDNIDEILDNKLENVLNESKSFEENLGRTKVFNMPFDNENISSSSNGSLSSTMIRAKTEKGFTFKNNNLQNQGSALVLIIGGVLALVLLIALFSIIAVKKVMG